MKVPNFFIGFQLYSKEFQSTVENIQLSLISNDRAPQLNKCITPATKLHFTCMIMSLNHNEDIQNAINCFESCKMRIIEIILSHQSTVFEIEFTKFSTFNQKVLYLDPNESQTINILHQIQSSIEEEFYDSKWKLFHCLGTRRNNSIWIPHVTIAKTSADRKNGRSLSIKSILYDGLEEKLSKIKVPVVSVDLLSMREIDSDGYYKRYSTFKI
jgi:2'-5' RNA ligase